MVAAVLCDDRPRRVLLLVLVRISLPVGVEREMTPLPARSARTIFMNAD